MRYASVLELQMAVMADVFGYKQIPANQPAQPGSDVVPLFASLQALDAWQAGAVFQQPTDRIALGVARAEGGGRNMENELVVICQDRRLVNSEWVEKIRKIGKGEVRVIVSGPARIRAATLQQRCRPPRIGCSVAHPRVGAGTLGCFVRDRQEGSTGFLSNNHVLAAMNRATMGDPSMQPGKLDGGRDPNDRLGILREFVPLDFNPASRNFMDAAWSQLLEELTDEKPFEIYNEGVAQGALTNRVAPLLPEDWVAKVGRTSDYTAREVVAVNVNHLIVAMQSSGRTTMARFDGQVVVQGVGEGGFSKPGDSGSVVFDEERNPAALLFAGTETGGANKRGLTYASPIGPVLDALDLEIFTR